MTRAEQIAENLDRVREEIAAAAARAGRRPEDVTLVAVSKTKPAADIAAACEAGQRDFGENYAQELDRKCDELGAGPRFHMIGHLQRNKVKLVVGRVVLVQTVDSLRLAQALARRAAAAGLTVPVLLEVNVGGEWSKSGLAPDGASELLAQLGEIPQLEPRGLMCIPPFVAANQARPYFRQLRELRETLVAGLPAGHRFDQLSMGMSHDFAAAVEEGATIVRVGTAIFGERG